MPVLQAVGAVEASRIVRGLYVGSRPRYGAEVREAGFHTLVLAAEEYQPPGAAFPGVLVVHAPYSDEPYELDERTARLVEWAASVVASEVQKGRRVLVTCQMGLNRSALIATLALVKLTGMRPRDAIRHVQQRRPRALFNPAFVSFVLSQ